MRTRGCDTNGAPTLSPAAADDVDGPLGENLDSNSASFSTVNGVCSDGLRTTVLPAASAGASFHAAIIKG